MATELAKATRREGQRYDSASWLHKTQELAMEEFKREVSKHLSGKGDRTMSRIRCTAAVTRARNMSPSLVKFRFDLGNLTCRISTAPQSTLNRMLLNMHFPGKSF